VVVSDERRRRATPDVVHPMVRVHPYTGKKCLYVNEGFTIGVVGLPERESRSLLEELYAHIARPQGIFRHRWRMGDLVMWDNYATQHRATVDFALPKRRLMHRTTLCGVTLQ
jgi:taurine dioxygenase